MDEVRELLAKRVGPLPVGAWALAGAAGVAIAVVFTRSRKGPAAGGDAGAPDDGATSSGTAAGGSTIPGGFAVGSGGGGATGSAVSPSSPLSPIAVDAPTSNEEWQREATRVLTAQGYAPTLIVDQLGRWLSGLSVTSQGAALIDIAVRRVGPPPIPVPPAQLEQPAPSNPGGGSPDPSPGGGGTPPAVTPAYIARYNGGPDGPGSFVAVLVYTDGSVGWITGPEYSPLRSSYPERVVDAGTIHGIVAGAPKRTGPPTPGYLPPATQSVW